MKYINQVSCLGFLLLLSFQIQAQNQHDHHNHNHGNNIVKQKPSIRGGTTEIFMVYGNCGMCEKRIENSLIAVDGVLSADWDSETKVMTVKYEFEKISLEKIQQRIAAVGHDTDSHKASKEAYSLLPACCQYDRKEN